MQLVPTPTSIVSLTVNPALDVSSTCPSVCPDRKLRCCDPMYEPGGGGINVAKAIQLLGGTCHAIWSRGGVTGQMLHELLDAHGVPHTPVLINGMTRENLTVTDESNGCQYRFCHPGPRLTSTEEDLIISIVADRSVATSDFVVSGGPTPGLSQQFWIRLFTVIPDSVRITIDTSGIKLEEGHSRQFHIYKSNLGELRRLVDLPLSSDQQIVDAARGLIRDGLAKYVVTSLGSGGVILASESETLKLAAPTVSIKSRVGAGDSMTAGLVLSQSRGHSIQDALRYGVAAGTAAVMTPGSQLCNKDDVERLIHQIVQTAST